MLEISSLHGGWGPTVIVEDFSLSIADGETVSIIGRNGVGKSTLLELLMGRAQHRSGEIRLGGAELSRLPIHERARLGIGYVPQQREVFPNLTVHEHLTIAARPGRWTEKTVLELFPTLGERFESLGNQLSGGEQQMLAIARALLGNPRVILMDEPSEGLAPVVVEQLVEAIRQLVGAGSLSVLLVEQSVDVALDLSTRCVIMDRGRIAYKGESAALSGDQVDIAALMGLAV